MGRIAQTHQETTMKRFKSMIAMVLTSAGLCSVAIAQDRPAAAGGGYTSPQTTQNQQGVNPTQPSNENLDANAQRAHSPSMTRSGPSSDAKAGEVPASPSEVRDWSAIDKNHDNLISSEEMEAYLKEGAPQTSMSAQPRTSQTEGQPSQPQQQANPSEQTTSRARVAP